MSDQNGYSRRKDMELFEITSVIVGGDPVSLENKIWVTRQRHFELMRFWNRTIDVLREEQR
ncbi:hypothetical protein CN311_25070 [Mesorhizobium sanjuanii]|uniref:Uncharacterized protein n=1 Tax=Mesorhizobium sanjuanii TaxID=2037900 RepID=A0A2A6F8V7_9HYPH|nr:hypothetical protein [Mesorhizobium sanjuanii]PDQ18377.1 hypothetical protein CN311_25070 [Mesorhizobium sanjuanii]